ncbi:MAG: competence protein CoiA family protein [Lacticaseibacillus paracasei]|uniref:competence protein CoiA n=1 Tax=Lacticaseibacillus paracasei TaxID=1597 RepID=UPI00345DB4B6
MFVALDKNNQRVTLTSHAQAANLTHQTFHCPICKQVVRIKNGTVMPAHFAHRSQPMGEGEPESIEHLTGKWWLASWLKQHGEQATLEHYDATIRQRADLLVASKPPRVLEFQASPLSVPDLQKRTMMYHARGWQVTWVLGHRYWHPEGKIQARKFLSIEDHRLTLWHLQTTVGELVRIQFGNEGRWLTRFQHDDPPTQTWQAESTYPQRQIRQIAISLQKRVQPWMTLQAAAYQQGRNLNGSPWFVHSRPHVLRHFGIPELQLRLKWLLIFEGQPFTATANRQFWQAALPNIWTPLLPAGTLGKMMGAHWLQVLLAEGFVVQEDGCRYQWQRLPVWFADLERKLAMKKDFA